MYSDIKLYTTLWRESNAVYEEWAKKRGISYCELLVMLSLYEGEAKTQKDICSQWILPKQTVHTILKSFVERSWVVLSADEKDRRNKKIRLTPQGESQICSVAEELREHELRVWNGLGRERAALLIEVTAQYNRLFKEGL